MYRAEVCECVFAHAFVFVHVSRIMHLPGVNEPDVGGGGGNKIFASCDTDLFYHQLEVPVRRSIISN